MKIELIKTEGSRLDNFSARLPLPAFAGFDSIGSTIKEDEAAIKSRRLGLKDDVSDEARHGKLNRIIKEMRLMHCLIVVISLQGFENNE